MSRRAANQPIIDAYKRNQQSNPGRTTLDDVGKMTSSLIGRASNLEDAQSCLDALIKAKLKPNVRNFTAMISACGRAGDLDRAFSVLEQMRAQHVAADALTYTALLTACADA
ncbi:MAG TPA: hypothetical protein VFL86_27020, partial [Burkholderiaceae bacterium]|nr:hypothetical protein [Burkholderiaceae bacterium]